MKSKVMNRPMFLDVENVGIMQGFKDDEYEDDYEDMDEGYESAAMIDRTPSSPEILMNNLRGDMRSVDARMEELAQLVGEEAAMETPAEVLALLQPVLATQEGIGSLPAGMPTPPMGSPPMTPPSPMGAGQPAPDMGAMMPPGAMPPEAAMMPPGPPPTAQEPLQMADGGLVQRFRDGSDEEGVTPAIEQSPPADPYSARGLLDALAARRDPQAMSRAYEEMLPMYQQVMGGEDRSMTQAQILFDIAQAGLNLAAGTDAQGRPVRPGASFASSLASAAQGLPERIGARVGQMQQQEQGTRLAALKGAQEQALAQQRLEEGVLVDYAQSERNLQNQLRLAELDHQRSLGLAEARANLDLRNRMIEKGMETPDSPFGKSQPELAILNRPGLLDRWVAGDTTPAENNEIDTALTLITKPRTEYRQEPTSGNMYAVTIQPRIPDFVRNAMNAKGVPVPAGVSTLTVPAVPLSADGVTPAAPIENAEGQLTSGGFGAPGTELDTYTPAGESFFNLAGKATGPINISKTWLARNPFLLGLVDAGEQINAQTYINAGINSIVRSLGETERFGIIEKQQILDQIGLLPKFIDDPLAYQQAVVGLDNYLMQGVIDLRKTAANTNLPVATRREALTKLDQLRRARNLLGAPPRVYSEQDFNSIQIGQPYINVLLGGRLQWKNREIGEQGEKQ